MGTTDHQVIVQTVLDSKDQRRFVAAAERRWGPGLRRGAPDREMSRRTVRPVRHGPRRRGAGCDSRRDARSSGPGDRRSCRPPGARARGARRRPEVGPGVDPQSGARVRPGRRRGRPGRQPIGGAGPDPRRARLDHAHRPRSSRRARHVRDHDRGAPRPRRDGARCRPGMPRSADVVTLVVDVGREPNGGGQEGGRHDSPSPRTRSRTSTTRERAGRSSTTLSTGEILSHSPSDRARRRSGRAAIGSHADDGDGPLNDTAFSAARSWDASRGSLALGAAGRADHPRDRGDPGERPVPGRRRDHRAARRRARHSSPALRDPGGAHGGGGVGRSPRSSASERSGPASPSTTARPAGVRWASRTHGPCRRSRSRCRGRSSPSWSSSRWSRRWSRWR